jgi:hypothetical protein
MELEAMNILIEAFMPESWRPSVLWFWENRSWFVIAFSVSMFGVAIGFGISGFGKYSDMGQQ